MTQTQLIVKAVMENEAGTFLLAGCAFTLLVLFAGWVLRTWSWIPRKDHSKRVFIEKF